MPEIPRLELDGIGCRFGAVRALDAVSLAVAPGEIVGLLGDSGCGKSTLLRIVAGLERPDRGTMRLDGRPVGPGVPPEARGIGMMFQDYALFPHLTVAENVRFGLAGLPRARAGAVAAARLAEVGLTARAGHYPATLSGGEAQRVALARALAPGPRLLLLDEPFSNLDRRTRDRVRADTLAVLREAGATALLVTHDPEEALEVCDRIGLMRAGRLAQTGTGAELYRRPASLFAARFLGELGEIPGRCRAGSLDTPFGALPAPGFAEGAPLCAAFRPAALRIADDRPVDPAGDGVPARVLRRIYLGAGARLEVAVAGIPDPLRLAVPPEAGHAPGSELTLTLDRERVYIFADDRD